MTQNADLAWQAFRYVADELAADERERFERRLESDQAAREAVSQAVALAQTLAAALRNERPMVVRRLSAAWAIRYAGIAVATAAAVLAALALPRHIAEPTVQVADRSLSNQAPSVALAWTELRSETSNSGNLEADEGLGEEIAMISAVAEELGLEDDVPAPPRWLVLATSSGKFSP